MSRCIRVKVAGGASGANMMDMFADEEKQRISSGQPQYDTPPRTGARTFGQDGKERDAQKRSGCETDQRTKRLVLQPQRRADGSASKGENISRDDLQQWVGHSRARASRRRGM